MDSRKSKNPAVFVRGFEWKQLFEEKITPRNREEDGITGYRDVLNTIHESNACRFRSCALSAM